MSTDDVDDVERVCEAALWGPAPEGIAHGWWRRARVEHLLATDPGGAWVALDGGVVGVGMALRREALWGLSLLAVEEAARGTGAGRALLDRCLTYAEGTRGQLILSSEHPAALRLYARSGFAVHPALDASGLIRFVPETPASVRAGTETDFGWIDDVARHVRGGPYAPDVRRWLSDGAELLCVEGRGWALCFMSRLLCLMTTDEEAGGDLLDACLARVPPGKEAGVEFLSAGHDWAVRRCLAAGLALTPAGCVFTRGETGTLRGYLPNGAYL
jgi:GNAT superfamily N-acetyltransferase